MTPEQFIYWLQGYFEIAQPTHLGEKQTQVIKDHLALVLNKVTPDRSKPEPAKMGSELTPEDWARLFQKPTVPYQPQIEPFPQYPGVIPGISPLLPSNPDYTITCSATGSPDKSGGAGEPASAVPVDPFASPAFKAAFDLTKIDPETVLC